MKELFEISFSLVSIIPTTVFLFVIAYWLIVLIGLIDIDTIDVEVDTDTDLEIDTDGIGKNISWFNSILLFFKLNYLPLLIFLSFFALPFWLISVLSNYYLGITTFYLSLILLVPNLILSLFIARFASLPIAKLFQKLNEENEASNPIGKVCELTLSASNDKLGQALIQDGNNTLRISVIANSPIEILKGEKALVISFNKKSRAYIIEPYH